MKKKILEEEKVVLKNKTDLICDELKSKEEYRNGILDKIKKLSKQAKGSYNAEKETLEKTIKLTNNDIVSFEEAKKKPYFARIDFDEKLGGEETLYIGKKGIINNDKVEEVVVDWRAPVADLYYSGTYGRAEYKSPSGVIEGILNLKRKFIIHDGVIENIFDEGDNLLINNEEGNELVDEFLKLNLEESRGKKLKEVVATIQKEQNEIIRWPRNFPIIVQGSAGSGKTTVALHRLAYLIYKYKEDIHENDILVLAPNKLFLNYISDILPSLGADEVKQFTFYDFVKHKAKIRGSIYTKDDKLKYIMHEKDEKKKNLCIESARFRGSIRFKEMIDDYMNNVDQSAKDIEDIKVMDYVLFRKREIIKLYSEDFKSYPINKRKNEIRKYFNLKLKDKINSLLMKVELLYIPKIKKVKEEFENPEEKRKNIIKVYDERDAIKNKILKDSKKIFEDYFKKWKGIGIKDLYYNMFSEEESYIELSKNYLSKDLAIYIRNEYLSNRENNIIDEDDLVPFFYLRILLDGVTEKEKYKHIVVDEAQDYSEFQVYLISRFSYGNSITLVGDLAQGIYYYKGINTWDNLIKDIFNGDATYVELTKSYRSTVEIIEFADKVLNMQNLNLKSAKPVLRHGIKPKIIDAKENPTESIDEIIDFVHKNGKNSIGIITKDLDEGEKLYKILKKKSKNKFKIIGGKEKLSECDNVIIPSYLTKGLEFDCTVIYDPSSENYNDNILDKKLLYVVLTRALHYEFVLKIKDITSLI
ncbi:RNA polymerase recycling motor HelD [Clostridium sp. BJN0001]|uniref:RNA polymerase recycling motor HelD n=1 Tax=Clostridium sp. BJN0001 TaxID=2930219 RepID=UPI001FD1549A|nr:RNA polymerase recycling motor HelD [Clostridium sp. BJN0001]